MESDAGALSVGEIFVVEHGGDGSIAIRPTPASQLMGTFLLVLINLFAAFPIGLLLLNLATVTWGAVAILGGSAVAWVLVATFWQAGNQPWTIHADANQVWMTRRIFGRQTVRRGALDAIFAASGMYWYGKGGSKAEPTYYFVDRSGRVAAGVKAGNYARADLDALARYLNVPLKGDFDTDINEQLKRFSPETPRR
jgi:hypothetical protein